MWTIRPELMADQLRGQFNVCETVIYKIVTIKSEKLTSLKIPASVLSQNGRLPQSKIYVMTPMLQTSDSGPDFRFRTSGAT